MKFDTVIVNGLVVTPRGTTRADVGIRGGRIAALGIDLPRDPGTEVIDASGRHVIPGLVDPEAHLGVHRSLADDFLSESQAAAAAGVTTWGIQITSAAISDEYRPEKTPEHLVPVSEVMPTFIGIGDRNSYVDYFLTPSLNTDAQAHDIPGLAEAYGVTSFKFHLHTKHGAKSFTNWEAQKKGGHLGFDDGTVMLAMKEVARLGPPGIVALHTENWEMVRVLQAEIEESGRKDMQAWTDRSPDFVEAGPVRAYAYYGQIFGCPLYIMHVTTPATVAEVKRARAEGVSIMAQTGGHYLTLPAGTYKINVPLRPQAVIDQMWPLVAANEIHSIGSDHVCHTAPRDKLNAGDVWTDLSGFSSRVEALLPMLLSEGVNSGRITIERLVELACEAPARAFGLYPLKGTLEVGADADVVLVDLDRRRVISKANLLTNAGWSAWEGREVRGVPVLTMLRGKVVARSSADGRPEIVGSPRGTYRARKPGHKVYPLAPMPRA